MMFPGFLFQMENVSNKLREHWGAAAFSTILCIVFVAVALGDGAPNYPQFPSAGKGFLMPWLTWTTADRWRLHEIEPIAYGRVCCLVLSIFPATISKIASAQ
jgi:hypothetical protein